MTEFHFAKTLVQQLFKLFLAKINFKATLSMQLVIVLSSIGVFDRATL